MKTTNKIHYVYKITNLKPTDERLYYIGVHSDENQVSLNDGYMGSSKYLTEAIKETGQDNFKKEILSTWATRKEAVQEEIRLHEIYDVAKNPLFYNRSKQTSTRFDTTGNTNNISKETRIKQIQSRKKNNKMWHSEKTKQKIGNANRGKVKGPLTEETKQKISKNNAMHKSENRLKVSESLKGHLVSSSTKQKIGNANRGKVRTEEVKALMRSKRKISNNSNSKIFILISPDGKEYFTHGNLKTICKSLGLNADTMSAIARGKRKIITSKLSKMKDWNAILCKRVQVA